MELDKLEIYRSWWKKQPATIQGFTQSYRAETPSGDILEVDFNFHDRLVRLSLQISEENGKIYAATVQKGSILKEKDITFGRNYPIHRKIAPFRDIFSCLPNPDILESIGGAYEISPIPLGNPERRIGRGIYENLKSTRISDEYEYYVGKYDHIFGIIREPWHKRWFRKYINLSKKREPLWVRFKRRFWAETLDIIMGIGFGWFIYNSYYNFIILGLCLGAFGLVAGGMDWILRKRDPLIVKVLSFLALGSFFFYNGYTQY